MYSGAKLRLPALSADVQPSAKDFVDVSDGERYMVQLGSACGTLEKEEVVVPSTRCTSHEDTVPGTAVSNLKAQHLRPVLVILPVSSPNNVRNKESCL